MTEKIVRLGGVERTLNVEREGPVFTVRDVEGNEISIEVIRVSDDAAEVRIGETVRFVPFMSRKEGVDFVLEGETWSASVSRPSRGRKRHAEHSMSAPMPGQVLKIFVAVGEVVAKGAPLLVLEAMKMEHQITAPWDGRVESIACAPGDLVQPGVDLISVTPETGE